MVQAAMAIAILAMVLGVSATGVANYMSSNLPYKVANRVSASVNAFNSAVYAYITQNATACISGSGGLQNSGCTNVSNGYAFTYSVLKPFLPGNWQENSNSYVTPDGTSISAAATSSNTYTVSVTPSSMVATVGTYLANSFPGGKWNTGTSPNTVTISETTPAIANMMAANKPSWGTLSAGGTQNTGGGALSTQGGWINTSGGNITSGSLNTGSISSGSINTNGQPIQNYAQGLPNIAQTYLNGWVKIGSSVGAAYDTYGNALGCPNSQWKACLVISPGLCFINTGASYVGYVEPC